MTEMSIGLLENKHVRLMYDGAVTTVRSGRGKTLAFEIKVGVLQGSCLSPLLLFLSWMPSANMFDMMYHGTCCMQMI